MNLLIVRRAHIRRSLIVILSLALTLVLLSLPDRAGAKQPRSRPPKSPTTTAFSTVPSTVPDDCGADATASLQSYLDSVPDGTSTAPSVITFPSGSCYRIEGTLHLTHRSYLRVEGGSFRAFDLAPAGQSEATRNRSHWRVESSMGIAFVGTAVEGPVAEPTFSDETEAQHGFVINGASHDVTLTGVRVTNVLGDFVAVSKNSSDVEVAGGTFSGAGRQGFSVNNGSDVVFRDNQLTRVNRSAVDIEPLQDWEVHRVAITGNTFTAPIGNVIFANVGTGESVTDIAVSGNAVVGAPFSAKVSAPCGQRRSGYTITDNVSDVMAQQPLSFKRIDDLTIVGNTFPTAPEEPVKGGTTGGIWAVLTDVGATEIWGNETGASVMATNPDDC